MQKQWLLYGMTLLMTVFLCVFAALPGEAQIHIGVQGSYGEESDWGIGARLTADVFTMPAGWFELVLSGDYFFPEDDWEIPLISVDYTYYEINGNVVYNLSLQNSPIVPYAGVGINVATGDFSADILGFELDAVSETETGVNILGGLKIKTQGRLTPFVEFRYESGGGDQYVITGGILF
jgi:hypothetical protein